MTNQVHELARHLLRERVGLVVLEATSDYWRQFYFILEEAGLNVQLVNARDARNLPGRKTDASDSAWLAQLGAHGLVRRCFVPPADIRRIRDLTRARTAITDERSREILRLEKMLEDSGIKLSSVATDITGVSGRLMLEALIGGEEDPIVLAEMARTRMRPKIPALVEALTGRFNDHHSDMTIFPTAGHLASWAGTAPGADESAGRVKSTKTRPGEPVPQTRLATAALSLSRSQTTSLGAKYHRVKPRRGPMKALVALEHSRFSWPSGTCSPTANSMPTRDPITSSAESPSRTDRRGTTARSPRLHRHRRTAARRLTGPR